MITSTQIYWITRCSPVREFLAGIDHCSACLAGVCAVVAAVLAYVAVFASNGQYGLFSYMDDTAFHKLRGTARKWTIRLGAACVALWFVGATASVAAALTPTTKEMAAIMVIPRIADSKVVSDISGAAGEIVTIARDWLKELASAKGDTK